MKNTNTMYTKLLFEQFKQAMGMKPEEKLTHHRVEFKKWLLKQQEYIRQYVYLLMEMDLSEDTIVELGKGRLNSIVPVLNCYGYDAISLTPFDDTFQEKQKLTAYNGQLIDDDFGLELQYDIPMIPSDKLVPPSLSNVGTLVTQLPIINLNQMKLMISTYLQEHKTIVIGSYGSIHDMNFQQNLQLGTMIKDYLELVGLAEVEFVTYGDIYAHIVKSKFKTKKLTLSR